MKQTTHKLVVITMVTLVAAASLLSTPKTSTATVPVSDGGVTANTAAIQRAAKAINDAVAALMKKEYEYDPQSWAQTKTATKKLVADMTKFVNSGYDGAPAFVTSLAKFMEEVTLITTAQFAYSDDLKGLSDATEFPSRIAAINAFNRAINYSPKAGCDIDELTGGRANDFYQGNYHEDNYQEVFECMTQYPQNTPLGASFGVVSEMWIRNQDVLENERQQLQWSQGYLVQRYCEDTPTSSGGIKRECINTQPGALIKDIVSQTLGALPTEILLAGDELDEGISETFSSLSNQIIAGKNGLLGIGASPLSDNSFGDDGQSSYLNVLSDNTIDNTGDLYNPIQDSLDAEIAYQALQQTVIDTVNEIEATLVKHASSSDCFKLKLSDTLKENRDTATAGLEASLTVQQILEILNDSYINAETQAELDAVLEQYNILDKQGIFTTKLDNETFEIQFLNYEFKNLVDDFKAQITAELTKAKQQCPSDTKAEPDTHQ